MVGNIILFETFEKFYSVKFYDIIWLWLLLFDTAILFPSADSRMVVSVTSESMWKKYWLAKLTQEKVWPDHSCWLEC